MLYKKINPKANTKLSKDTTKAKAIGDASTSISIATLLVKKDKMFAKTTYLSIALF